MYTFDTKRTHARAHTHTHTDKEPQTGKLVGATVQVTNTRARAHTQRERDASGICLEVLNHTRS